MAREFIQRYADYDILSVAPSAFNYTTDERVVLNDLLGASGSFKVYDPSKDEVISVDEATGQSTLSVTNAGEFDIGDAVEVTQDDLTLLSASVDSVDSTNGTITLDDTLTDPAAAGSRVRVIFGASIAMAEYGTANLNTRNWGYRGVFPSSNVAHDDSRAKDGLDVNIEIRVNDGTSRDTLDTICATIREDDCA
jgi:hypothetical protein